MKLPTQYVNVLVNSSINIKSTACGLDDGSIKEVQDIEQSGAKHELHKLMHPEKPIKSEIYYFERPSFR